MLVEKKVTKKRVAKKKVTKKKVGRPTGTWVVKGKRMGQAAVQSFICDEIAGSSMGLKTICDSYTGMPSRKVVYEWIQSNPEFRNKYARAKEHQAHFMAEEILEIADDARNDFMVKITKDGEVSEQLVPNHENVQRSRLRVDSRKWLMSKLLPKKYGDRMIADVTTHDIPHESRLARAKKLANDVLKKRAGD